MHKGKPFRTFINVAGLILVLSVCQHMTRSMRSHVKESQHLPRPIVATGTTITNLSIADLCEEVGIGGRVMTLGEALGHPVKCVPKGKK